MLARSQAGRSEEEEEEEEVGGEEEALSSGCSRSMLLKAAPLFRQTLFFAALFRRASTFARKHKGFILYPLFAAEVV